MFQKTTTDKEMSTLESKVKKLESLCRALQQERNKATPDREAAAESGGKLFLHTLKY